MNPINEIRVGGKFVPLTYELWDQLRRQLALMSIIDPDAHESYAVRCRSTTTAKTANENQDNSTVGG